MKVCLVNSFYPPYIGGAETYVSNLARNLAEVGHEITVFCASKPLAPGVSFDGAVKVVRLGTPLAFYGTPLARFPATLAAAEYDVVHCNFPNPYFAMVSAAVSGVNHVPAVLTWHNDLPAVTGAASLIVRLNDLASFAYLASYSRIIATTTLYSRTSKTLRRYGQKLEVIPNGVDTKRFNQNVDSSSIKEAYRLNGKTLLTVGALTRWHQYKGLNVLLEAFKSVKKRVNGVKLLVVGGGEMKTHYMNMAAELGIGDSVIFAGVATEDELPKYYAASDLFILPSTDMSEGFGIVLLEAMAAGRAVIGTRVGGVPEVIANGQRGVLVEANDVEALAESIVTLLEDDQKRKLMGTNGRIFSLEHDWGIITRKVLKLYESLAN